MFAAKSFLDRWTIAQSERCWVSQHPLAAKVPFRDSILTNWHPYVWPYTLQASVTAPCCWRTSSERPSYKKCAPHWGLPLKCGTYGASILYSWLTSLDTSLIRFKWIHTREQECFRCLPQSCSRDLCSICVPKSVTCWTMHSCLWLFP